MFHLDEKILWEGKPYYFGLPTFTNYKITNERLIVETGLLTKRTKEIEWFRVKDISVKRNLIERIFNIGDITISSIDTQEPIYVLRNIKDSEKIKDYIRNAVREQRNTQKIDFPTDF